MQVLYGSDGNPTVKFRKAEAGTLRKAQKLLDALGRCARNDDATTASAVLAELIEEFIPEPKPVAKPGPKQEAEA